MSEPTIDVLDLQWPSLIETPYDAEADDAGDAGPGEHLGDQYVDYGKEPS